MVTKEEILRITEKVKSELKKSKVKVATSSRLYEYELNGLTFYTAERITSGIRVTSGRARYTTNFYTVTGEISKALKDD